LNLWTPKYHLYVTGRERPQIQKER
jgi:hypothetical protein